MGRKRRFPTKLGIVLLVVTWGMIFWVRANGERLNQMLQPTPTALEARFETMRIYTTDFPESDAWQAAEPHSEAAFNAPLNMVYVYDHKDAFWIKVSQYIRIYPDTSAAQAAYNHEVHEWFTAEWEPPSGLAFSDRADMLTVRCIEGYINNVHHYPCTVIGVYDDTVIILVANVFDDQWFTMEDFARLLTVMDQRIVDAIAQRSP